MSTTDMWPYRITIAAMWRGLGDTKNAMSGNLMSWLCTTMMLCAVTIAENTMISILWASAFEVRKMTYHLPRHGDGA